MGNKLINKYHREEKILELGGESGRDSRIMNRGWERGRRESGRWPRSVRTERLRLVADYMSKPFIIIHGVWQFIMTDGHVMF